MVTRIESYTEPVDPDPYRFFTQLILFLVFMPILLAVFVALSILWFAFTIVGMRGLAQGVSPGNFLNLLNSSAMAAAFLFSRRPEVSQARVLNIRVQNRLGGDSRGATIKGELGGDIHTGDEVVLSGDWRQGTLRVRSGFNRTLNCALALQTSPWRGRFFALVVCLLTLGVLAAIYGRSYMP